MMPDALTEEFKKALAEISAFKRELAMGRILRAITAAAQHGITLTREHHYFLDCVTNKAAEIYPDAMFGHDDAKVMEPAVFNYHYSRWIRLRTELQQRLGQYLLNQIPTVRDSAIWYDEDAVTAGNMFVARYVKAVPHHVRIEGETEATIFFSARPVGDHWIVAGDKATLARPYRLFHDQESAWEWALERAKEDGCVARRSDHDGDYDLMISYMGEPE